MSIMNFLSRVFGSKSPTTQATKEWPEKIQVKIRRKEPVETFQSRWGYHPVSYETFLKLKELHKWYYQTLRDLGRWVRWDRKTVHKHGPEPKYCPTFVEDKVDWWYSPSGDCKIYPKTRTSRGVVAAYHAARMPKATPEEVEPLEISNEEIERLHAEVSAWFRENS